MTRHKLDELCSEVQDVTESDCVVLMVIVGNHIGYSAKFSCEPHLRTQALSAIASQLRHIAGEIETDAKAREHEA